MTRDTASSSALVRLAPAVVVAVVVTASHIGSLANGLTLDARALVLGNPALREATWANVRTILTSDYWSPMATNGLYRPVTTLSFLANWALLGNAGRPLGYHVVNLLLHLCCALAALALFRRLGLATAAAVVATLLFAVHPVTTEVVANVAGRADLLAALGVLCGLLCQARARAARGGARMAWETGLVAAAVLGMFAKENAVVLLPLLIVWEALSPSAAEWRARARGPALAAGVAAVMLAARWWVRAQGYPPESSPLDNPILEAGLWEGRATALGVLAQQAGTLVWPAVLRADYSYDQIPVVRWPPDGAALARVAGGAVLLAALAVGAWRARRTRPALAFLLAWILVTVLPTANLLVVIGSIRADRFLYLPLVGAGGALVVLCWGTGSLWRRRLVLAGASVAVALAAVRTSTRAADWRDDLTLWRATVAVSPRNAKAQRGFGMALAQRGHAGDRDEAIRALETAVAIRRDYLPAWIDLGGLYLAAGDAAAEHGGGPAARRAYRRALGALNAALPLDHAAARRFRRAMRAWGRPPRAIPDYGNPALYQYLVVARARLGHWRGVLAAARSLARLDPRRPASQVDAAAALVQLGRLDDAAVALHQALLLGGDEAGSRLAAVYRMLGDAADGAVVDDGQQLTLVVQHPLVRRHRCRASEALAARFDDAALPGEAARFGALARELCAAPAANGRGAGTTIGRVESLAAPAPDGADAIGVYFGNPLVHDYSGVTMMNALVAAIGRRNRTSASSQDTAPRFAASYSLYGNVLASEHVAIRPGGDAAFLLSLLHVLAREALVDRAALQQTAAGWDALEPRLAAFAPERTARLSGIDAEITCCGSVRTATGSFPGATVSASRRDASVACCW